MSGENSLPEIFRLSRRYDETHEFEAINEFLQDMRLDYEYETFTVDGEIVTAVFRKRI